MLWRRASWVIEMRNMISAPQNALIMTPERRSVSLLIIPSPEAIRRRSRRVARLPKNAVIPTPGKRESPASIPKMAPMPDPLETPNM